MKMFRIRNTGAPSLSFSLHRRWKDQNFLPPPPPHPNYRCRTHFTIWLWTTLVGSGTRDINSKDAPRYSTERGITALLSLFRSKLQPTNNSWRYVTCARRKQGLESLWWEHEGRGPSPPGRSLRWGELSGSPAGGPLFPASGTPRTLLQHAHPSCPSYSFNSIADPGTVGSVLFAGSDVSIVDPDPAN